MGRQRDERQMEGERANQGCLERRSEYGRQTSGSSGSRSRGRYPTVRRSEALTTYPFCCYCYLWCQLHMPRCSLSHGQGMVGPICSCTPEGQRDTQRMSNRDSRICVDDGLDSSPPPPYFAASGCGFSFQEMCCGILLEDAQGFPDAGEALRGPYTLQRRCRTEVHPHSWSTITRDHILIPFSLSRRLPTANRLGWMSTTRGDLSLEGPAGSRLRPPAEIATVWTPNAWTNHEPKSVTGVLR